MMAVKLRELLDSIISFDDHIGGIENALADTNTDVLESDINSIVHDHREARAGSLYIAIAGTHIDGHQFISVVKKEGAIVIGEKENSGADIVVGSTRAVIGPLAHALKNNPTKNMNIVGITGTNGKTTTTYLYASIMAAAKKKHFVIGTTGILVDGKKNRDSQTTPDPIILADVFDEFQRDGINDGAMEVSSHALDQERILGTSFAAVAFTNFSQDHLDYHKRMEDYFDAKAKLFSITYAPIAVVNIDDVRGNDIVQLAMDNGQKVITCSCVNDSADVFLRSVDPILTSTRIEVTYRSATTTFTTPLIGEFNCENIAIAAGLAYASGYGDFIAEGLSHLEVVSGRLERVPSNDDFAVFVDYAHTPDALERVCNVIRPLAKRLILVFGCGGDRDKSKRPLMGAIASTHADIAIATSDNPRSEDPQSIIDDILTGTQREILSEVDRRDAIRKAIALAQSGDAIIIAGKGHETYQEFADHTDSFSDVIVAQELLQGHS
jgi:UDP-N-acetylmuramoyl-L-alanyl-D-glutamate--2,6-diaminopimelate ligase